MYQFTFRQALYVPQRYHESGWIVPTFETNELLLIEKAGVEVFCVLSTPRTRI